MKTATHTIRRSALLALTALLTVLLALTIAVPHSAAAPPASKSSPPEQRLDRSGHTKRVFPQEIMKAGNKRLSLAQALLDTAKAQAAKDKTHGADTAALDLIVDLEGAPADLEAALLIEAQTQGAVADVTPSATPSALVAPSGDATFPVTIDGVLATAGDLTLDLGLLTADDRAWFIDLLGRAYPAMVDVYGPPAAPLTVRVWKNVSLPYQGLYAPAGNLLLVRSLAADVAIHELLHAFRDEAMSTVPAYEEGIVRAAEVTVLDRLGIPSWDSGFSYVYDRMYDSHNADTLLGSTGTFLAGYGPMYLLRYQTAGMAWAQAEIARPGLLREFNTAYVKAVLADPARRDDAAYQASTLASLAGEVEGRSLAEWAPLQRPLAPTGGAGVQLHADVTADTLTVRLYTRDEYGFEAAAFGTVAVEVSDPSADQKVRTLSLATSAIGMAASELGTPTPRRLDVRLTANTPGGTAGRELQVYGGAGQGLFGIIPGSTHPATGTVSARIATADGRSTSFTAPIIDHAFQVPGLGDFLGVVTLTVTFEGDSTTWQQVVVKGRGDTYVALGDLRPAVDTAPAAEVAPTPGTVDTQPSTVVVLPVAPVVETVAPVVETGRNNPNVRMVPQRPAHGTVAPPPRSDTPRVKPTQANQTPTVALQKTR